LSLGFHLTRKLRPFPQFGYRTVCHFAEIDMADVQLHRGNDGPPGRDLRRAYPAVPPSLRGRDRRLQLHAQLVETLPPTFTRFRHRRCAGGYSHHGILTLPATLVVLPT
jgi:hypothetical protein